MHYGTSVSICTYACSGVYCLPLIKSTTAEISLKDEHKNQLWYEEKLIDGEIKQRLLIVHRHFHLQTVDEVQSVEKTYINETPLVRLSKT